MSLPFLWQPQAILHRLPWRFLVLELFIVLCLPITAKGIRNITLQDTASQIIYSPPACGLTLAGTEICNNSWRILTSPNASDGTITTTSGPTDVSGGFIPQLFLSVRALALDIRTSPASNAIVNVSVSTVNPVVSVTAQVNSSIQPITIIGLVEDRLTTLALTFDASNSPTVLDIDSITVTISDNNTTPFVAPSPPASTALPPATPSVVIPSPTQPAQSRRQTSGDTAAEVLGALLGVALIAGGAFLALRLYRKPRRLGPKLPEYPQLPEANTQA